VSELDSSITGFGAGLLAMGFLAVALFFLRFWRRTRDSLFACFALAFLLMAFNQAVPVLFHVPSEEQAGIYLFRLAAYGLIIGAIMAKNMGRGRRP
jgi:hypothetical protein